MYPVSLVPTFFIKNVSLQPTDPTPINALATLPELPIPWKQIASLTGWRIAFRKTFLLSASDKR